MGDSDCDSDCDSDICQYEEWAREQVWPDPAFLPNPQDFKRMVELCVESGRRLRVPDSLLAHYLHLFLLSKEEVNEAYAFLCDRINFGNLVEIISILDSLQPMAWYAGEEDILRVINPKVQLPIILVADVSRGKRRYFETMAGKITWPNPKAELFQKMIGLTVESAKGLGCPDSLLATSLFQFLLSNEQVASIFARTFNQINYRDLAAMIANLDSLNASAKYLSKDEIFREMKPKSGDNSLAFMQRLIVKADEFFGKQQCVPRKTKTQFLENYQVNGAMLNPEEIWRLKLHGDWKECALEAQEILERKSKEN